MPRYHINWGSATPRGRSQPHITSFYAADDTAAAAIAAVFQGVTTAQMISLTKSIMFDNSGDYPDGSEFTATAIIADVNESVYKFRARNMDSAANNETIALLLEGAAGTTSTITLAGLDTTPALPNTLLEVDKVRSVAIIGKNAGL